MDELLKESSLIYNDVKKEKNLDDADNDSRTSSEDSEDVHSVIHRSDYDKKYLSILIIYLLNVTIVPMVKYFESVKNVLQLDVVKENITNISGLIEDYIQTNIPCHSQQDIEFKNKMLTSVKEVGAFLAEYYGVKEEKKTMRATNHNNHNGYKVELDGLEKYFKYIIGKKGCTIQKLRKFHNVKIFVPYPNSTTKIIIDGNNFLNVTSAIKSILDIAQQKHHKLC